ASACRTSAPAGPRGTPIRYRVRPAPAPRSSPLPPPPLAPRDRCRPRGCRLAPGRRQPPAPPGSPSATVPRSEEHTSELQSRVDLVCRLLLEKKNITTIRMTKSDTETEDPQN